jgi:hypothetical protein
MDNANNSSAETLSYGSDGKPSRRRRFAFGAIVVILLAGAIVARKYGPLIVEHRRLRAAVRLCMEPRFADTGPIVVANDPKTRATLGADFTVEPLFGDSFFFRRLPDFDKVARASGADGVMVSPILIHGVTKNGKRRIIVVSSSYSIESGDFRLARFLAVLIEPGEWYERPRLAGKSMISLALAIPHGKPLHIYGGSTAASGDSVCYRYSVQDVGDGELCLTLRDDERVNIEIRSGPLVGFPFDDIPDSH